MNIFLTYDPLKFGGSWGGGGLGLGGIGTSHRQVKSL